MSGLNVFRVLNVDYDAISSKDEKLLKCIHKVGDGDILFDFDSDNCVRVDHFLEIDTIIEINNYTYDLFREFERFGFSDVFLRIIKKAADLEIHHIVFENMQLV